MINNHVYMYYLIYNHISYAKNKADGRPCVYCSKHERFADCWVIERYRFIMETLWFKEALLTEGKNHST